MEPGVPLDHLAITHRCTGVRFACTACQRFRDLPVAEVIARLKARGLGDGRTGVRELAHLSDRPCPRCGARAWSTAPAWC